MTALGRAIPSIAAACALLAAAPTAAHADLFSALQDLTERPVTPAPLVPTTLPSRLGALDAVQVIRGSAVRRGGYSLTFWRAPGSLKMTLVRGGYASLRALDKDRARLDRVRKAKVRGRKGELRTAKRGKAVELAWSEGGRLYELGSTSRGQISAKDLQKTARSLDRLDRSWSGGSAPDGLQSAVAVTTAHTITVYVEWVGNCQGPPGTYAGTGLGTLLPIKGGRFAAANLPSGTSSTPWSNQVSGTVAPGAIQLSFHAQTTYGGVGCDTGQVSFGLTPLP
jgi:hypothetical protein